MAYLEIANMAASESLSRRITAAAASEAHAGAVLIPDQPESWAGVNRWVLCAAPGWADAWASAEAADVEDPGADPGVITDGMILSEVQALLTGGTSA
jgi:hypothetical protein